jgi:predicted transcriptional regulator
MPEPVSLLTIEFLAWVSSRRRTYAEAMEAWRSTCPRHTVWEDALADGLIEIERGGTLHQSEVSLTAQGRAILDGNNQSLGRG